MAIHGTAGNDTLAGTGGDDLFKLWQGGNDTADGGDGNDIFRMRGTLNAEDRITGGDGTDMVTLNGDYSTGLIFDAATMVGVETLRLAGSHDYDLTMNDGNVAAGESLTVNAGLLGAGHGLTFDGGAELDGHFTIQGSAGNDDVTGGAQRDKFYFDRGGNDTADGGGGNDAFYLGAQFKATDSIDGGAGFDTVTLTGIGGDDFITMTATTMLNVDKFVLIGGAGINFGFSTVDATVAAGATLTVDDSAVTQLVTFDGSVETDGHFAFIGGTGQDRLTGGDQADTFDLTVGGNDEAHGGGGDDTIDAGVIDIGDTIDGGTGFDILNITGDVGSDTLVFGATTVTNIDRLVVTANAEVSLQSVDATVAAGATMELNGSAVTSHFFSFNGGAELDGYFDLTSGSSSGSLIGGALSDTIQMSAHTGDYFITGGGGADDITCNTGVDKLIYSAVSQSNSAAYDRVHGFDAAADFFDMPFAVTSVSTASHAISTATFDSDMGFAISDQLCCVVTASGGDLMGHVFLFVDGLGGGGGYQAGLDYIIDITAYTGTLTTGNFI